MNNPTYHRLRNDYARLLVLQLEAGRISAPFDKSPPDGPLPNLPGHVRSRLAEGGYALPAPSTRSGSVSGGSGSHLSTGAGSAHRGGVHVGGVGSRDAAGAAAGLATLHPTRPYGAARAVGGPGSHVSSLGNESGKEARVGAGAGGGGGYPPTLRQTTSRPPRSASELASELGASRERNADLNWRLRVAEDRLRDSSLHLSRVVGEETARRVLREDNPVLRTLVDKYTATGGGGGTTTTTTTTNNNNNATPAPHFHPSTASAHANPLPLGVGSGSYGGLLGGYSAPPSAHRHPYEVHNPYSLGGEGRARDWVGVSDPVGAPRSGPTAPLPHPTLEAYSRLPRGGHGACVDPNPDCSDWTRAMEEFRRQTELLKHHISLISP